VCATSVLERLEAASRERDVRRQLAALKTDRDQERGWMEAVCESARGVAGDWELAAALDRIVHNVRFHLDVERACIYRYLPDERAVQLLVGLADEACPDRSMRIESLDRLCLPLQTVLSPQRCCRGHAGKPAASAELPGLADRGAIAMPIVADGQIIGAITAENPTTGRDLPDSLRRPLALLADFAAIALTHARRQRELAQAEAQKKQFYRDILCAVTNGKLTLCERDEIEQHWSWPCVGRPVRREEDIRGVREAVTDTGLGAGLPQDRVEDLCLCASEAATNALKHAGGGEAYVVATPTVVRVRVEDRGGGIDPFHLPRATLMKGYSTRASMGLGFTLMHELADRLYLNTSADGTTVILEMALDPVTEVEQILSRLSLGE
jgi:anti-sigma regulatory factor (Ser/Thr protein kinase)